VGLARRAGAGHMTVLVCLATVTALAAPLNLYPRLEARTRQERPRLRFEPVFLLLGGLCALGFVIEGGLEAWSAVHLERTLGADPAVGGLGPGIFAAAMLAGRTLAHVIGSRLTDRRLLAVGASLASAGLLLSAAAPGIPWHSPASPWPDSAQRSRPRRFSGLRAELRRNRSAAALWEP
jgi:hypothetical protein